MQLTISTAESCTGGYIAHQLIVPSGASSYFMGGIIAYGNRIKIEQLNVDEAILNKHGAVSREVAELMAKNVAQRLKTDCSIAVSGIMGPDGGTREKPVGTVWISTTFREKTRTHCYQLTDERLANMHKTCELSFRQFLTMLEDIT